MDKNMVALVKRSKSTDPTEAAEAKAELDRITVSFKAQKRSGVETR